MIWTWALLFLIQSYFRREGPTAPLAPENPYEVGGLDSRRELGGKSKSKTREVS